MSEKKKTANHETQCNIVKLEASKGVVFENIPTVALASLDTQNFEVMINGEPIEYEKQILTSHGLEISSEGIGTKPDREDTEILYIL
jgi:hypothetical protein